MKLYYLPGACSLATRIILNETNTPFTSEKVDPAEGKTETGSDYTAINEKGYVPLLITEDGTHITEGTVVLTYLAEQNPDLKLLPATASKETLEFKQLLAFISTEIHKSFTPLFAYPDASADQRNQFIARLKKRISILEDRLSDGRAYLMGSDFTIVDAYALVTLNWHKFVNVDLSEFPKVLSYLKNGFERPSVHLSLQQEGLA